MDTITEIHATGYAGQYTHQQMTGGFNTDGNYNLRNISGSSAIGTFEAYREGDGWQYNPHFTDLSQIMALMSLISGAITGVEADLATLQGE